MHRNVEPTTPLYVRLSDSVKARMDLYLYSEAERRIPYQAHKNFIARLVTQFFDDREIDLAPYLNTPPGVFLVRGKPETLARLIDHLKGTP